MKDVRLSIPTVLVLIAIASAAAFAAGRSTSPSAASWSGGSIPSAAAPMTAAEADDPSGGHVPAGHLPPGASTNPELPVGHPPIDSTQGPTPGLEPARAPSSLVWTAPARWQSVPNASSMRLATYRIPRAPGDTEDAELSIMQAGGSVDANVARWIGQFDAAGQKTAKRSTRKVGALEVTLVEVQGNYSGGMGKEPSSGAGWALLGAIVSTPDMPHFFKLTGPAKTVVAARGELEAMIGSLTQR